MTKMHFLKQGFRDVEGGVKKTLRWTPYMEYLDSLNSTSCKLIPTESGAVGNDDRFVPPMKNQLFNGRGSSNVVPTVL